MARELSDTDWSLDPLTFDDLVEAALLRLQRKLASANMLPLDGNTIMRLKMAFSSREQYYIVRDLDELPLHCLCKRIKFRMDHIAQIEEGRGYRFNCYGSEEDLSSDTSSWLRRLFDPPLAADSLRPHPVDLEEPLQMDSSGSESPAYEPEVRRV